MSRFAGASIGYDVKGNQKEIKITPGPGDYENFKSKEDTFLKTTHNYALNNGGVQVIKASQTPKETLIAKSFNIS